MHDAETGNQTRLRLFNMIKAMLHIMRSGYALLAEVM